MTEEEIKKKGIEKADEILMILGRMPCKGKVLDYGEKNAAAYNDLIEIAQSVGMEITSETAISTMFCVEVMRRLVRSGTTERMHLLNHIENIENRKKGKWKFKIKKNAITGAWSPSSTFYPEVRCSICKKKAFRITNYCPNCGAKMESEEHD